MKKIYLSLLVFVLPQIIYAQTLFQSSIGNGQLLNYDQAVTNVKSIKKMGNFGYGMLQDLSAEVIAVDGKYYQFQPGGKINSVDEKASLSYAMTTNFKSTESFTIEDIKNYQQLVKKINSHVHDLNTPYAVKIEGDFDSLKLGAIKTEKFEPNTMMMLLKNQAVYQADKVQGFGVGFYIPNYLNKINFPGYHLHFITADKKMGGHILDLKAKKLTVSIMVIDQLSIQLPQKIDFLKKIAKHKPHNAVAQV